MKGIKIGVIEDQELILYALVNLIATFDNCSVTLKANNGAELLAKLGGPDDPDICVLDICMPVMNGFDTLIQLKKNYPKIKIIILTEYSTEYAIMRLIKNGANAYLLKNCSEYELRTAIEVLSRHSVFYSEIAPQKMFVKAATSFLPDFSERELTFLKLCCKNKKYAEIAKEMYVSERTIENYYNSISKKLNIKDKSSLISYAKDSGLVYSEHGERKTKVV